MCVCGWYQCQCVQSMPIATAFSPGCGMGEGGRGGLEQEGVGGVGGWGRTWDKGGGADQEGAWERQREEVGVFYGGEVGMSASAYTAYRSQQCSGVLGCMGPHHTNVMAQR